MNLKEQESLILIDDDGGEFEFKVVDVFTLDGLEYAVLKPEDGDLVIFQFGVDENGEEVFLSIEDDEEWERIADAWEEMGEGDEDGEEEDQDTD